MRVRHAEGLANHSDPESCTDCRETVSEALTGEHIGQPLSRERNVDLSADTVQFVEGNTTGRANASARRARRGRRPWHVWTLLVREPGDLGADRRCTAGPRREGEEP